MKRILTGLATLAVGVLASSVAFASGHEGASADGSIAFAAAIIMAVASGMGTLSQSRAAASALEGISRNPQAAGQVQMPLILSLALMESLVIFALVIAYFLQAKIG